MSQGEVIDCLKRSVKPMTRSEIAKELGISKTTVSILLKKLLKYNEILIKELDRFEAEEQYGIKRRLSLFYLE